MRRRDGGGWNGSTDPPSFLWHVTHIMNWLILLRFFDDGSISSMYLRRSSKKCCSKNIFASPLSKREILEEIEETRGGEEEDITTSRFCGTPRKHATRTLTIAWSIIPYYWPNRIRTMVPYHTYLHYSPYGHTFTECVPTTYLPTSALKAPRCSKVQLM